MSYKQIYPPWYEIVCLLYYTLGQDCYVNIREPECIEQNRYSVGICVNYKQQADYIRVIVPTEYRIGNTVLCTHVYSGNEEIVFPCISQKNQRDVANIFCNALRTNPLFRGVELVPQSFVPLKSFIEVWVVQKCIPSFQSCGYERSVADAFAQVVKLEYGNLISTGVIFKGCQCGEIRQRCLYCKGTCEDVFF